MFDSMKFNNYLAIAGCHNKYYLSAIEEITFISLR